MDIYATTGQMIAGDIGDWCSMGPMGLNLYRWRLYRDLLCAYADVEAVTVLDIMDAALADSDFPFAQVVR